VVVLATLFAMPTVGRAAAPTDRVLKVATKPAPPFSVKQADGTWTGKSIELWRDIADELGLRYELHETDLDGMLAGVADGRYDAGVAAITVTSAREEILDFTAPFHTTGLAIAVHAEEASTWRSILAVLGSRAFLELVLGLGLLFFVVGGLMWAIERRANPQFGEGPVQGVGNGYWWTVVTMTTVGYGDKTPRTVLGRLLALGWMMLSVVIISSVTATIASNLTIEQLEAKISEPADLSRFEVGTVVATTSESYLRAAHLDFRTYPDAAEGLADLANGEIEAFVYDEPLLRPVVEAEYEDVLRVLPNTFQRQDYAIALPPGSELREPINRVLPTNLREAD
jgi:ABC-type amino acid transport substrate-binding protein